MYGRTSTVEIMMNNDTLLSRGLGGNRIYWPRPEYVLEKSEALAEDFSSFSSFLV